MKMSYGFEIEWGDIERNKAIPEELGSWEGPLLPNGCYAGAECDIINSDGTLCDPLAETTILGGEINVAPATSPSKLTQTILAIGGLFDNVPYAGFVNHGHVHIYAPEIDLSYVQSYAQKYEVELIETCYDVEGAMLLKDKVSPETYEYLMYDGGRINSFDGRKTLWWDTKHESSSSRAAINLANLNKGKTIEFRCFRSSINGFEIFSTIEMARLVLVESQRGRRARTPKQLAEEYGLIFPKIDVTILEPDFWKKKHTKERGSEHKYRADNTNIWKDIL